jgi:hypothetical protein
MTLDQNINKINFLINYDITKPLLEQENSLLSYVPGTDAWDLREKNEGSIFQTLKDWNRHDWLELGELTTGLLGMVPIPPFALAMNALSIGFGAANAALFAAEGDSYSASIALALAMIPGPETYKLGKQVFGKKGGKEVMQKLLLKKAAGEALNKEEVDLLAKGLKELSENSELFNFTLKNSFNRTLREMFNMKGIGWVFKFLLAPVNNRFFKNVVFPIYGATVGVDSMYYLYTLTQKGESRLTLEEKRMLSDFKPLVDLLKNPTQIYSLILNFINPKTIEDGLQFEVKYDPSDKTLEEGKQKLKALSSKQVNTDSSEKNVDGFPVCVTGDLFLKMGSKIYQDKKGLFSFFDNNRVLIKKQKDGKRNMGNYSCSPNQNGFPSYISTNEYDNAYEYKVSFNNLGDVVTVETKKQNSNSWIDVTQKQKFKNEILTKVFGINK